MRINIGIFLGFALLNNDVLFASYSYVAHILIVRWMDGENKARSFDLAESVYVDVNSKIQLNCDYFRLRHDLISQFFFWSQNCGRTLGKDIA